MTSCRICGPEGLNQYRCNCKRRTSPKVKAHLASVARRGAVASAKKRRVASFQRWRELVKGMSVTEAWRHVWLQGYNAGYERRRRMERAA